MIESMGQGLQLLLSGTTILWMLVGILLTTIVAIIPGLGGPFVLVMLLPLVYTLQPESALAMLMASVAVAGTGNTITGVLFGVPGSASGMATVFDGYPMARKGEGTRAVTAGVTASAVGGIGGAVVLALILPAMRPIVLAFGPPEFCMLAVAALVFMAYVTEGTVLKSLIAGLSGLMLAFVGLEIGTGTTRYTFGQLYLWDGIQLVPMMIGLFAIAEMMALLRRGGSIAGAEQRTGAVAQTLQGVKDVFIHWRVTLQSSATGVAFGLAPGVGATSAQFVAYTQALRMSKRGDEYGTGVVEGVIAADAATNSKDGGDLVPSLAFGVPGSPQTAILLAAMITVGIQPGPEMLTTHVHIIWMFIWVLVIANIIAALLCIATTGLFARVTRIRSTTLAPIILLLGLFGAYATSNHVGDVITALAFGVAGYMMMRFKYSRATFSIGFVLGIIVERNYLLSMRLYGWEFLLRPVALGIVAFVALVVAVPEIRRFFRRRKAAHGERREETSRTEKSHMDE